MAAVIIAACVSVQLFALPAFADEADQAVIQAEETAEAVSAESIEAEGTEASAAEDAVEAPAEEEVAEAETVVEEEAAAEESAESEQPAAEDAAEEEPSAEDAEAEDAAAEEADAEKPAEEKKPVQSAYTELQLCFVEIDADGSINRKLIKRQVAKNDSPLTTAIKAVLAGPDTTKPEERDCISLIPNGTRLLGARVSDGVAYLDFSDAFEINTNGIEGYTAQLMQIVYTATTFSTVNSVQFLIEGQKKEYLGSEGQWIGSPLSRTSF